ncbi:antibiotic transport system ATP-binding protein [Fibrisoma limi BUZ 3]|uniref:Antibiotic transport system ATP-binding protein n=1 Tax=Fibrisoma limi BUZ 3 TaxID=1185876 RepID=I2GMJ0_9BACT|nr:ABC transporter ATP-binding protein [Fibrisoma limi]CCH55118.1 antibiotic transport system ATP-binding protein [Fibrisoma limi BUZ 3]
MISPPPQLDTPAVRFTQVSKRYGNTKAVDGLDLTIPQGGVVALLGPNGAGKSTTIGLLLGLMKPDSGRVELLGNDPRQPKSRQVVGAMLQDIGAPDTLRVHELIDLWSSYYELPLPLDFVLDVAGLAEIRQQKFGKLSGGQRRRVAFGIAICGNPDILVLDEPTAGLDLTSRSLLWQQVRHFARTDRTVILSTHHLEEADALADRIVLLNRGRLIADGTPEQIKAQVGGKRIRCRTRLDVALLQSMPLVADAYNEGSLTYLLTHEVEMVLRTLLALDPTLSDLDVTGVGLEEAFLRLTDQQPLIPESK